MIIRLAIRGFLAREKKFEQFVNVPVFELDEVLPSLGERHCRDMAEGVLDLIEIEFLDEPIVSQRFFRISTTPDGMLVPVVWDMDGAKI